MKALRFYGPGDLRYEDRPDVVPGPGEVRIRPAAVGICGTDLHILDGSFGSRPPVILGHEVAGHVDAVGPGVSNVHEGDLVTVEPHRYDGTCRYCRIGREHLCLGKEAYGVHLDGGMAEAQVIPARITYRLPSSLDPRIAAMTEPVACCVHAIDRLDPVPGLSCAVLGAGPAGLILIALARLSGLTPIVAVEPNESRRHSAEVFGADGTVDPEQPGWVEACLAKTGGEGFDFVIEAVGSSAVLESAFSLAARGARILVFGVAESGQSAAIRPQEVFAKELTILGTVINPFTHHRAIELLPSLRLERLGIRTYPLSAHREAFEAQRARLAGKIQFTPQAS